MLFFFTVGCYKLIFTLPGLCCSVLWPIDVCICVYFECIILWGGDGEKAKRGKREMSVRLLTAWSFAYLPRSPQCKQAFLREWEEEKLFKSVFSSYSVWLEGLCKLFRLSQFCALRFWCIDCMIETESITTKFSVVICVNFETAVKLWGTVLHCVLVFKGLRLVGTEFPRHYFSWLRKLWSVVCVCMFMCMCFFLLMLSLYIYHSASIFSLKGLCSQHYDSLMQNVNISFPTPLNHSLPLLLFVKSSSFSPWHCVVVFLSPPNRNEGVAGLRFRSSQGFF